MNDYEELRNNLISMLEELDERLVKITDEVRHADEPVAKDFAEQATETENDQVLDYLGNATRSEIEQVKTALSKIDKGGYGFCEMCGESIKRERLQALPFSRLCIKCAKQLEN